MAGVEVVCVTIGADTRAGGAELEEVIEDEHLWHCVPTFRR